MTIKVPKKTLSDKLLTVLGKRRAAFIPSSTDKEIGPYSYSQVIKESFFKALLRPKNEALPSGLFYFEDLDIDSKQ